MQFSQVVHVIGETILWLAVILVAGLVAAAAVETFQWYLEWRSLPDPLTLECAKAAGGLLDCEFVS